MLITVSLQSTTMRYNGQLHRTPRYSRVPARDDHGAPRCVGRDGRMRPTVQRVLGASHAAAARPARTHAAHATCVAFLRTACASQAAYAFGCRACGTMPLRFCATDAPSIRYALRGRMRRVRRASLRPCGVRVASGPFFGRRACGTREPSCPRNGDLRRRPPFHAARCRAAFATSEVADNQKRSFSVTIFRVGVKL